MLLLVNKYHGYVQPINLMILVQLWTLHALLVMSDMMCTMHHTILHSIPFPAQLMNVL